MNHQANDIKKSLESKVRKRERRTHKVPKIFVLLVLRSHSVSHTLSTELNPYSEFITARNDRMTSFVTGSDRGRSYTKIRNSSKPLSNGLAPCARMQTSVPSGLLGVVKEARYAHTW